MKFFGVLTLFAIVGSSTARSWRHVGRSIPALERWEAAQLERNVEVRAEEFEDSAKRPMRNFRRQGSTIIPQNKNTTKYAVDGSAIPDVTFDVGEVYAGLMPIGNNKKRQLYFFFVPTKNPDASDEILIWLNGGPGCSSLEGLFQENGPFVWQYGTVKPYKNPWAWSTLTNVVWVEQPVGTGFTQGKPTATSTEEAAQEFLLFWKNFMDTFGLQNRKVYITGESYAGMYVPYIAGAMLDKNDTVYYGVEGTMIYDPSIGEPSLQTNIQAVPFAQYHQNLFNFDPATLSSMVARDKSCGYASFRQKYFKFPPSGQMPNAPSNCGLWGDVYSEVISNINPCFDIYQIATTCPLLYDPLGFPGSIPYKAPGSGKIYFNRADVKRAINAPVDQQWAECSNGVLDTDTSLPSALGPLPSVIERSKRTIIGHGALDFVLVPNGTLMTIQNMTWAGKLGFQNAPSDQFFVPQASVPKTQLAGSGVFGTTHTERGLTWVEVLLSGHMVPQYAPSASYRHIEFLLGRIDSLSSKAPFTTKPGSY